MMQLLANAIDEPSIEPASAGVRLLRPDYPKRWDLAHRFGQSFVDDRIRRGPTPALIVQGHPLS